MKAKGTTQSLAIESDEQAFLNGVTTRIVEMTQSGTAPWLVDRKAGQAEVAFCPLINPAPIYDGVNAILLDLVSAERGYNDPRWVPMALMESNGLFPKYKERPVCIAFRNRYVEVTDTDPLDGTVASAVSDSARRLAYYYVYNAKQIRGMPPLHTTRSTALVDQKRANALRNSGASNISELPRLFSASVDTFDCPAQETLGAIAKYRLACHLRLPYKAGVNLERARREVSSVDRKDLLRAAYYGANKALSRSPTLSGPSSWNPVAQPSATPASRGRAATSPSSDSRRRRLQDMVKSSR